MYRKLYELLYYLPCSWSMLLALSQLSFWRARATLENAAYFTHSKILLVHCVIALCTHVCILQTHTQTIVLAWKCHKDNNNERRALLQQVADPLRTLNGCIKRAKEFTAANQRHSANQLSLSLALLNLSMPIAKRFIGPVSHFGNLQLHCCVQTTFANRARNIKKTQILCK